MKRSTRPTWLTTPAEFPAGAVPAVEWRTGACRKTGPEEFWGFEDWMRVTWTHLQLEARYPERFRVVSYERFVADARGETTRLFDFLGLRFGEQTREFLERSQQMQVEHSHAVFKHPAVAQRWRTELDPSIRDAILGGLRGSIFERFLT